MEDLLKRIQGLNLLVIGDILLDHYVWGDASRISPEAPVPVVRVERDAFVAGGAANVALNLRALGCQVNLAGQIGHDDDGRRLGNMLAAADVRLPACAPPDPPPTIVKTRVMCRTQQLCRLDREASAAGYALDADWCRTHLRPLIADVDAVILSDYAKGVVTRPLIDFVLTEAHRHGRPVSLDPKPRRDLVFKGLDLMTPNRQEALQLARLSDIDPAAPFPAHAVCRRIHARFRPGLLVITLGVDGMLISPRTGAERQIPTVAREVFDVSGAGDTVIATLSAALAAGAEIDLAAHLANLAAGIVVGKVGTATASPGEILTFPREHPVESPVPRS